MVFVTSCNYSASLASLSAFSTIFIHSFLKCGLKCELFSSFPLGTPLNLWVDSWLPTNTNLTSAATVSGPAFPSTDDIRDIRQPRHFLTPWLWVGIAAGVAILGAAAFAAWQWLQHGKYFQMVPSEVALQRLEEARRLMDPDQAREYCFAVSKIIRSYLEDQLHLHAPRLTTEEFLRELVAGSETIAAPHRALLGDFLQHCDLAKFAGWRYSIPALAEMHAGAVYFVWQSSRAPRTEGGGLKPEDGNPTAEAHAPNRLLPSAATATIPAPTPKPTPQNSLANPA